MTSRPRRHYCRQNGCPNTYTDIVGGALAFGAHARGATCVPCDLAAQLRHNGQTPDTIERLPALLALCEQALRDTGWTWAHVKASYARHPVLF